MKELLILMPVLLLSVLTVMGQKKLDEFVLVSPYLEKADLNKVRVALEDRQKEMTKGRGSLIKVAPIVVNETQNARYFNLAGTQDIVIVSAIGNKDNIEKWDDYLKAIREMYSFGNESHLEYVDIEEGRGAILVIKKGTDYEPLEDIFFYQNRNAGVTLEIRYISRGRLEKRLENMRNILRNLKVEVR